MKAEEAASRLGDPDLGPQQLAQIAYGFPELRLRVAEHPNLYPGLSEWLTDCGEPVITELRRMFGRSIVVWR